MWRTNDEQWKEGCIEIAAIGGDGSRVNLWGAATSEETGCFRIYSDNTNSDILIRQLFNSYSTVVPNGK